MSDFVKSERNKKASADYICFEVRTVEQIRTHKENPHRVVKREISSIRLIH